MSSKAVFVAQMQEADRRAIQGLGLPGCVLMYNAGKAVTDFLLRRYPAARSIGILAGKGNNAGDGFVIAHLLKEQNKDISVVCLSEPSAFTGDASIFMKLCQNEKINFTFPESLEAAVQATKELSRMDLIVDALLGTGIKGTVREPYASVIKAIPESVPVLAVDLPSGINGDTGEECGCCVHADSTVTLAAPKVGLGKRPDLTGELTVADIGMPKSCLDDTTWHALTE